MEEVQEDGKEEEEEQKVDERERMSKAFFMYHDPFLTNNFEPCVYG